MSSLQDPQVQIYRRLAPWQRLAAASQLYFFARGIVKTRMKKAHPHLAEREIEKKVRELF